MIRNYTRVPYNEGVASTDNGTMTSEVNKRLIEINNHFIALLAMTQIHANYQID